jgi:dimethylhistidine N-methyltransferase
MPRLAATARLREAESSSAQFASDVQYYLMQDPRQLPSRYLYDPLGSALFESICHLPWYRVTRAEERLLVQHGADIMREAAPLSAIVELGSGSGEKLRILIDRERRPAADLAVHLVDISRTALDASVRAVETVPGIQLTTHEASYEEGLQEVSDLDPADRVLVLFLGSNIGNYDPPGASAFLRTLRGSLRPGDGLLLGADLVKPERDLLLAYDDPLGVTAAFNRNLLVRINRELGGDFDLQEFAHQAVWNTDEARIEMHLVSRSAQHVHVRRAAISFAMEAGESIWTESSYKFGPDGIVGLVEPAGFRLRRQWVDGTDRFALTLFEAA